MNNSDIWKIIHSHFEDNPQSLVRHHIESYNDFLKTGIFQIFKDKNKLTLNSMFDNEIDDFRHQCTLYFGGKNGDKIYFGKPVIYDNDNPHYMFPNEARLRNMNYEMTVHYDIEVEFIDILEEGQEPYQVDGDMMGGNSSLDLQGDDEHEFMEEYKIGGNFKKEPFNVDDIPDSKDAYNEIDGGAKKEEKKERKRNYKTVGVDMTTAMATQLREAQEKSLDKLNIQRRELVLEKIFLGKIPIMVQSEYCILNGLPRTVRHSMGECKNDPGGYFIIGGKEKTVITQEKEADNVLHIKKVDDEEFLYSADIVSVSENVSKPVRMLKVGLKTPTHKYSNLNMVVNIPNVKKPIPLFIVFRALGVISDKEIITMCLLDLDKYESLVDLFRPSVHDAGGVLTQYSALEFISTFTKYGDITYTMEILTDYFLPHVGEVNYIQKAYYLGYMVFRLLSVYSGIELPTDRDNMKYKRVELVGSLMNDLFREYYTLQQKEVHLLFEKKLYYDKKSYADNLPRLIRENYREVFRERIIELGIKKAFKGNWGAHAHTKRIGVVQDLNRLSFNSMISHLRKTNLHLDAGLKLVGPRVLTNSQWGFFDPIDTPDGGNIGLHKTLAIATYVSRGYSREPMIKWLREKVAMKLPEECNPKLLAQMTRIMVNGLWAGSINNPIETIDKIKLFRRNALIPIYTSATFNIALNTIYIYTDAGRLCRPIFYKNEDDNKFSFDNKELLKKIHNREFVWDELISGFNKKKIRDFLYNIPKIYELHELYEGVESESNPARLERFYKDKAVIDYIDPNESENILIALNANETALYPNKKYTHMEIHESLTYGVMCNQVIYLENNPVVRNSFSCGQSKQAVSMYHTNHQVRMDKTAVVLNYGQIPLVKSRYLEHINHEENPYGENAIVAIMCYTGYNVEDAVLINEASIKRGMFNTTYYTVYEEHEETNKSEHVILDKKFTNIESEPFVIGQKVGYDYSKLDSYGMIKEGTEINDKTILIGLTSNTVENTNVRMDMSKSTKKGQLGIVDKTFITEGEEGERIGKVRIREIRIPNLGDKMASRSGQKGTVGMVIPECDMPFTKDGIRPDIIINPHAIPTRMTIGQLVECITGKVCAAYGGFGDCTSFNNDGSKIGIIGEQLSRAGFHSSGNEILYNGMTGDQIESDIFIGPTYYMRLKHMVKDKINYRATGPRTALTRQAVSGRANDGGLRIGEMERDVLVSHGITNMLKESMLERGDKYYMAVCNQTGMVAIYNPSKNLFMSPMADGPIQYTGELSGSSEYKNMNVVNMTKFGRDFSVICVPYSFKLLLQELQAINVQMRIITEDNISQLENLSFSKNIDKLTHIPNIDPTQINKIIKNTLENQARHVATTPFDIQEIQPAMLPEYGITTTPPFPPPEKRITTTPPFPPPTNTPPFPPPGKEPVLQEFPNYESPNYPPESPNYESPPYAPSLGGAPQLYNSLSEMHGGKKDFKLGDYVYYAGDTKVGRQWAIIDYNGEYYTISTNDINGEKSIHDTIKVVSPEEIYKESNIVRSNFHSNQIPATDQHPNYSIPPTIEVNPVINIVNGPDSSIDSSASTKSHVDTQKGGAVSTTPNTMMGSSTQPQAVSKPEPITKKESTGGTGVFDFFKDMVIKKLN